MENKFVLNKAFQANEVGLSFDRAKRFFMMFVYASVLTVIFQAMAFASGNNLDASVKRVTSLSSSKLDIRKVPYHLWNVSTFKFETKGGAGRSTSYGAKGNTGRSTSYKQPYGNLKNPKGVGPGKDFTATQKKNILATNRGKNDGKLRDDQTGKFLATPKQSKKGVAPSPQEAQVDHVIPKSPKNPSVKPGSNSYENARLISRKDNLSKSNK
ncbi:hypothetical protein ACO0LM_22275 [Undibacterium sp. Di26W]|uniref:hypothetical protein n=1 Tax=Undibacterium sp. Di26W TaxID=3413035 RepID=UPI003BF377D2